MFNTFGFNEKVFNFSELIENVKNNQSYYVKYNDYFLHDGEKVFAMIQYNNPKELNYEEATFGRNFGEFYNFEETKKEIRITGIIKTQTRLELLEEMEQMKKALYEKNKYLIIKENGRTRQIKGFCKVSFSENHYNINWIDYEVLFTSYNYLEDFNVLSFFGNQNTGKFAFSNSGTAESKYGINIMATGSFTNIEIKVNSNIVTLSDSFISGDNIFLNGDFQTIKKNTELINFDGEILFLNPGFNEVEIIGNGNFNFLIFSNISYK